MKIRLWFRNNRGSLDPLEITANSLKEALRILSKTKLSAMELYKAEKWTGITWKTFKRISLPGK